MRALWRILFRAKTRGNLSEIVHQINYLCIKRLFNIFIGVAPPAWHGLIRPLFQRLFGLDASGAPPHERENHRLYVDLPGVWGCHEVFGWPEKWYGKKGCGDGRSWWVVGLFYFFSLYFLIKCLLVLKFSII